MNEIFRGGATLPIEALVMKVLEDYQAGGGHRDASGLDGLPSIPWAEKLNNEQATGDLLEKLFLELEPYRSFQQRGLQSALDFDPAEKAALKTIVTNFILEMDSRNLLLDRPFLGFFIQAGYLDTAEDFMTRARLAEPCLTNEEIFQALRNVWIMNSLQLLWELPLEITPSVYSYSLLYPYTDNFLDDPSVATNAKIAFNQRLSEVLQGACLHPADKTEEQVYSKIRQIETQYARADFPRVWESIGWIQTAQTASLKQDGPTPLTTEEILKLSFFKGGTSVLADAFLVKGELTPAEIEFAFAYGAFLQLLDDFQDAGPDATDCHQTLFSSAVDPDRNSQEIRRLIHFILKTNAPDTGDSEMMSLMKEVIGSCTLILLMAAAGQNPQHISRSLYEELEAVSKVRLTFYQEIQRRFKGWFD